MKDSAILSILLDPLRLDRLAEASARAYDDPARSTVGTIVARAALTLAADHASFTLLGIDTSTVFSYGTEPVTRPTLETYCKFTAAGQPFSVHDAKRHPLVCSMEATKFYDIGSYLGVPVTFASYVLGALCVWSNAPRRWTAQERAWLASLAAELTEWWKT